MKKHFLPLATFTTVLGLVGCGQFGAAQPPQELAPVTQDDTPDLGDLLAPDGDATAADAQVGDPATLLLLAQDQAEHVRTDVGNVLDFLKDGTDRAPDSTGVDALHQPYAQWDIADKPAAGDLIHIFAIRTAPERVRIIVQGNNAAGTSLPILTGVFVKRAPRVGGGRFHVSLTNFSDLFKDPGTGFDGSLHFFFANHRHDLHGRRVAYLNVVDRANPDVPAKDFAADLVRLVGVGGRYRSIYAADIDTNLAGLEAVGMRVAWLRGVGGRADMVVATQANGGQILAVAHECWDPAGLRIAYKDSVANNDGDAGAGPDEGDVTNCFDLADATVDQGRVQNGGSDTDPDLDAALSDSGASDVTDADASDDSVPAPAP